jgi:hypothetical protein
MFESTAKGDLATADEVGSKSDFPCPTCGGRSYTWGRLAAQGINFAPDDAPMLAKFFRIGFELRARRCDLCGNLQIFARTPDVE